MANPSLAAVKSKETLLSDVVKVDFEMIEPPEIRYDAGQYIILHTAEENGKVVKRSYSIASPPSPRGFSLCVKVVGTASKFISELQPGRQVKFSGPWGAGKFTFPKETEPDIVMMATGTGISPIYSLLRSVLPVCPAKKFLFLWGLKKETDVFFQKELDELVSAHSNFSYRIVLSEPGQSWSGPRGVLSAVFAAETGRLSGKEYFLAGNGAMISAVEPALHSAGVSPSRIHKEIFFLPQES